MLNFDRKLTLPLVTEADSAALRGRGFEDACTLGIAEVAAFFNYTNRVAHAVGRMPNAEYRGLGR